MALERLPNEIFLDIFEYFSGVELLQTFYGLNSRLDWLLHDRFLNSSFQFDCLRKRDFDQICQRQLPRMSGFMENMLISDHEDTPQQCELFLSYIQSFDRFSRLKMLTLSHLRSFELLTRMIDACHSLHELTHLNLFSCYFQDTRVDLQPMSNRIWSLPRLSHLHLGIVIKGQALFRPPTIVSSSLVSVSIDKMQLQLKQIEKLYDCTPNLAHLAISIQSFADNTFTVKHFPTVTSLNIRSLCTCNASRIGPFLQCVPNLTKLNIDLSSEIVNGDLWEDIIRNHLTQIETLRLKMKLTVPPGQNIEQQTSAVLNTFQTPFWIDEHQWYVRCLVHERKIYLYTLNEEYTEQLPISFNTTSLEDDEQTFYRSITRVESPALFDQKVATWVSAVKLKHLHLNLPLKNDFWFSVPRLEELECLKLLLHTNAFQAQVQALLDRAPRLVKLIISQNESTPLPASVFKYTSESVRELDLRNINHYFPAEQCVLLSRSPLGLQCEKISMLVRNYESVLALVHQMPKLRSLKIRCQQKKEDCLARLTQHLPSTCVISEDPEASCNILLWI